MDKAYPSLELRLSTVLFWDVLGWSAYSTGPDAQKHLTKLHAALEKATKATQTRDSSVVRHVSWLTDNLVVGLPVESVTLDGLLEYEAPLGHFHLDAAYLSLYLLEDGYLSRGFASVGMHYQDENLAYGPALVEAVSGEKTTVYPRVALSEKVAELSEAYARAFYAEPRRSPQNSTLLREGSVVFVDYLATWLSEEEDLQYAEDQMKHFSAVIDAGLKSAGSTDVMKKWKWTADYFNDAAARGKFSVNVNAGNAVHHFAPFIA